MCVYGEVSLVGGSDGKESARNVGDLGVIPGLGRSLEKATHSSISGLENSMDYSP